MFFVDFEGLDLKNTNAAQTAKGIYWEGGMLLVHGLLGPLAQKVWCGMVWCGVALCGVLVVW